MMPEKSAKIIDIDNEKSSIYNKIFNILKRYRPSKLDEFAVVACPFYKNEGANLSELYRVIHDFAVSRVVEKIQLRLSKSIPELETSSEVSLKLGRADCVIKKASLPSAIIKNKNNNIMYIIEVKTGHPKLFQAAVYSFFSGCKTILVELKNGNVTVITPEVSKEILEELVRHIEDLERLKEFNTKIPGRYCSRCTTECDHSTYNNSLKKNTELNPLRNFKNLKNIEKVVNKVISIIEEDFKNYLK